MVVRRRKKKNKLRGKRSHGKGDTKNKRGAGCRGGRGRAGSKKHKFSKYYVDFGVKVKLKAKKKTKTINLEEISSKLGAWLKNGDAEKSSEGVVVDGKKLGYGKLLGRGRISEKIVVKNMKASKKAVEKVEAAGGKVLEAEENEQGVEE